MKKYTLQLPSSSYPAWHFDHATPRQLKLLSFFGFDISKPLTKGWCSNKIFRICSDQANKHLWAAYVYTTGDEIDVSTELKPHDRASLADVVIPDAWRPKKLPGVKSSARIALEQMVCDILLDGSPFDDPLPDINVVGTVFCFSGKFEFGTRVDCQAAVSALGGKYSDGVNDGTQVLVVGHDPNPNWSHGSFGNKILEAMLRRLKNNKPLIVPELLWKCILSQDSL